MSDRFLVKSLINVELKTGWHLTLLGAILLLVLGVVSGLIILAFHFLSQHIAESDGGIALAGASIGLGVAVSGVFQAAAKMLQAIPAILKAKGDILKVAIEEINKNSDSTASL